MPDLGCFVCCLVGDDTLDQLDTLNLVVGGSVSVAVHHTAMRKVTYGSLLLTLPFSRLQFMPCSVFINP